MLHRCPGRCRDLFDAPFFTRVGADRRSHEEQHDWKEIQVRNARSGRQEQAAQCFPHGFGETSTDSVDRIAQVGVGAAGNHQFEPRLVKRAVYLSQNEIDRDGTPVRFDRELFHLVPHLVERQFTQMLDRLCEQILCGRKVVEQSPARQSRVIWDPVVLASAFDHNRIAALSSRRRVSALFSSCLRRGLRVRRLEASIVELHASKGPPEESIVRWYDARIRAHCRNRNKVTRASKRIETICKEDRSRTHSVRPI